MKASEFIAKLQNIVDNYKTLYVMGCFGAPMTPTNKKRYTQNHKYNKQASRTKMINAASSDTFGFDCVCLIKGVLWGWNGNASKTYGGAGYACNGVPDIGADTMITKCSGVSTNFSNIVPGEAVWMSGHIGVYIGGGKVIECTPAFKNCVQVTYCSNIRSVAGKNNRKWTKHGKLPYITYDVSEGSVSTPSSPVPSVPTTSGSSNEEKIWNFLKSKGYNNYGIAGLMGNLYAESGLIPTNVQNSYERKLGYTDSTYTQAVDSGSYTNFVKDAAGYGLAQWTYWSRKQNLLNYAKAENKSIGDLDMQLGFLVQELSQYKGMDSTLKNAKSVKEASDFVLVNYERPANMSDTTKNKRASYGQTYYDKFAKGSTTSAVVTPNKTVKWTGKINATSLNVRIGAGTGNANLSEYPTLSNGYKVGVCDTVKAPNGDNWYYVKIDGVKGTVYGYVSAAYVVEDKPATTATPSNDPTVKPDNKIDKKVVWAGKVVNATVLNVRTWAGTENPRLTACPGLKAGQTVGVCDVVKAKDGSLWYYILIQNKWYGFVHSNYIQRV